MKVLLTLGSPALVPLDAGKLRAVLNEDEGFHQIGPEDVCADMFVLSVTVAFATKLEQVSCISLIHTFKGTVHLKMKSQSLITLPRVKPVRPSFIFRT